MFGGEVPSKIYQESIGKEGYEILEVRVEELWELLEGVELLRQHISTLPYFWARLFTRAVRRRVSAPATRRRSRVLPDAVVLYRKGLSELWRSESSSADAFCSLTSRSSSGASILKSWGNEVPFGSSFAARRKQLLSLSSALRLPFGHWSLTTRGCVCFPRSLVQGII